MQSKKSLYIVLIEPFYAGSHKAWADNYKTHTHHNIQIISLKGIYWKWRMHGGAITLAKMFNTYIKEYGLPDLLIVTDMLNLPVFESFANINNVPIVSFFHENQLTYPWSTKDRDKEKNRDHHYGFINYTTALRSNKIIFNSQFHQDSFIEALAKFLKQFPDHQELKNIDIVRSKSVVGYLGLDLKKFNKYQHVTKNNIPIILWNHRWEYDKNPEDFFQCLKIIKSKGIKFNLVILGEQFDTEMAIFSNAREVFQNEIIHIGYCESFEEYAKWLWTSDIIPVTSNQEFFGASIMEAVYCNVHPLLPMRLTYPELFNNTKNKEYFYINHQDLISKLKKLLENNTYQSLSEYSSTYDWSIIAPQYDEIIMGVFHNESINK